MASIDTLISKQERKLDLEIEILEAQLAEIRAKAATPPSPVAERRSKYGLAHFKIRGWSEEAL